MNSYYGNSHNKYGNKKVESRQIVWDSMKEANRYEELLLLQKAGKITNLKRQVTFEVIPAVRDEKGKILKDNQGAKIGLATKYVADFVYEQNGQKVVEDVKGMKSGQAWALFNVKRKLMFQRYGIIVRVI